jgi:hypothetical protein
MRPSPTILTIALTAAMWIIVPWAIRQRRARMGANPSVRQMRSYRLHNMSVVSAVFGLTWFSAWVLTDGGSPFWLHTLAAPAALVFIAAGAALAGYAGWLGGP